ncbi:Holliday junction ATP-dependent DNA helicase RuvA [Corynebacterium urogenitale]|uniref:Holliday junction branch migration complex subunit RuvA n=1 Tax=Corynebacterium urogenitale TaxID=2487892 RepID=A0A5J6Z8D0_9CORY|nr:Holliday junction branch migration protein RuvA [Corynebacterium urogenitale]QFQ02442.1 Holliday junction ATP-dependent DNA helicase RuvA [Corynebacterium urogenitale]
MIASLRGLVIDKSLDSVVIECAGVGYECQATPATLAQLSRGEEIFVFTAHIVREDAQTLYAFSNADQKRAFQVLQTVSGVGARLALGVLGTLSPQDLARAVRAGDVKALQKAPGVGKRLAERMAVDLKGKVSDLPDVPEADATVNATTAVSLEPAEEQVKDQAVQAMVGLGFSESDARRAVDAVLAQWPGSQEKNVSAVLRTSLASMNKGR